MPVMKYDGSLKYFYIQNQFNNNIPIEQDPLREFQAEAQYIPTTKEGKCA